MPKKQQVSYKNAVSQLEDILQQIESNELDVDELSQKLKEASGLIKYCKTKLKNAESEIEEILKDIDE